MKSVDRMSRSGIHEKRWPDVTEWYTWKALTGRHGVVYTKSVDRMSRSGIHEKRWQDVTEWYTRNALTGCHGVVYMKSVDRMSRSGIHDKRWPYWTITNTASLFCTRYRETFLMLIILRTFLRVFSKYQPTNALHKTQLMTIMKLLYVSAPGCHPQGVH
jgi:hypothetical protein